MGLSRVYGWIGIEVLCVVELKILDVVVCCVTLEALKWVDTPV